MANRHRTALDRARETLAEFFNCHDAEVVFNSGGTEGDNSALFGLLHPGDHLITTSIEHFGYPAGGEQVSQLRGCRRRLSLPQPSGLIDPTDILRAIRPETRLISVMLANNETGVLQPVAEMEQKLPPIRVFSFISTPCRGLERSSSMYASLAATCSRSAPIKSMDPRA